MTEDTLKARRERREFIDEMSEDPPSLAPGTAGSFQIRRLAEIRSELWAEASALLDDAEKRGDLTASQQRAFDSLTNDLERVDAILTPIQERQRKIDMTIEKYGDVVVAPGSSRGRARETREALRAFFAGEVRSLDLDLAGVHDETRDLTVGSATGGGNTVPTSFVRRLYEHLIESSAIRQTNVTVFTTESGEDLQVPKTTSFSTANLTAEAAAITESDPAFGQVTLESFKYGVLLQASSELVTDSGVDFESFLARQAGRALGNASGAHFVTGDGSGKPRGVVTAASVGVTGAAAAAGAFTADNLIDLFFSVIPEYRSRGYWMMSDAGVAALRKLKDADDNYLFVPNNAGGPDTLMGRPIVVDPNVADPAADAKSVVFGDFSTYAIRDVRTIRFERSIDFAFANDLVTYRALLRTDGDLIDETGAIKVFQGGAAS